MSSFSLKIQKNAKEQERKQYKTRKGQLETIRDNLASGLDSYAESLNTQYRKAREALSGGISGSGSVSADLWRNADGGSGDSNLSQSKSAVVTELRRVEDKISELDSEISRLETQITAAQQQEAEEAAKALLALTT